MTITDLVFALLVVSIASFGCITAGVCKQAGSPWRINRRSDPRGKEQLLVESVFCSGCTFLSLSLSFPCPRLTMHSLD